MKTNRRREVSNAPIYAAPLITPSFPVITIIIIIKKNETINNKVPVISEGTDIVLGITLIAGLMVFKG